MTDRHPLDCLLTPPDAALALRAWMMGCRDAPGIHLAAAPVLDPFAGAGTLLEWACPDLDVHAWELDARWSVELLPTLEVSA